MLKKTIKYTDFNGAPREEDFYFNLTKAELSEMKVSVDGGMEAWIDRIVKSENIKEIFALFKKIIIASYGEKSDDGKHFRKSAEISDNFISSPAFDELMMSILGDEDLSVEFVKGIMPSDLAGEIEKKMQHTPAVAAVPAPAE